MLVTPSSRARFCTQLWLCTLLSGLGAPCLLAETVIIYPQTDSHTDSRARYPVALLQLCLSKTKLDFTLRPSDDPMQQARGLRAVETNAGVDIVWVLTSLEREKNMRAIRIPIDRGLMGWRLLMIKQDDAQGFNMLKGISDLAQLEGGQGRDWADLPILRLGGLSVTGSSSYQGLFDMLARGHIDYFPRSVIEIWHELETHNNQHKNAPFTVAENIVIHYPAAYYFFVNKNNSELATAIEYGLKLAIADGSMQQLFNQFFHDAIRLSRLHERQVISLANPLLPKETPLAVSSYWFTPAEAAQ